MLAKIILDIIIEGYIAKILADKLFKIINHFVQKNSDLTNDNSDLTDKNI